MAWLEEELLDRKIDKMHMFFDELDEANKKHRLIPQYRL